MSNEELITILKYAYSMSRVLSPMEASREGLEHFDGSICDFYKCLVTDLEKGNKIDIQNDEFLKLVFKDMKNDLGDRDIEYDDIFIIEK